MARPKSVLLLGQGIVGISTGPNTPHPRAGCAGTKPAGSAAVRLVQRIVSSFIAALALAVLTVSSWVVGTYLLVLFMLFAALVTLLLFCRMRQFEEASQVGGYSITDESFNLTWRLLILALAVTLACLIVPIPASHLPIPSSPIMFHATATATATADVAVAPLLLFLLYLVFLLLLLWCVVCESQRFHDEQGHPFFNRICPGLTSRSLFLVLSFILSCAMLSSVPTAPAPAPATATATAAAVVTVAPLLLFLLFPVFLLLLLWCVVRGSQRFHNGQGHPLFNRVCHGLASRPLFLVLSFILSCAMLPTAPTAPVAAPVVLSHVAAVFAAVILTIIFVSLALSSRPPAEPAVPPTPDEV